MAQLVLVYSTFPNKKIAQSVADKVIEQKLAACVVLLPALSSTYMWKGKRVKDKEVILLAKTAKKNLPKLLKKIENLHPYECPCILTFKPSHVNKNYLDWIS